MSSVHWHCVFGLIFQLGCIVWCKFASRLTSWHVSRSKVEDTAVRINRLHSFSVNPTATF